jgi:hypothetical protein
MDTFMIIMRVLFTIALFGGAIVGLILIL